MGTFHVVVVPVEAVEGSRLAESEVHYEAAVGYQKRTRSQKGYTQAVTSLGLDCLHSQH